MTFRNMNVLIRWVLMGVLLLAELSLVTCQSVPEAIYSRGCRSTRGQFPHETYCHQYYNCWDGRATVEQCPGELLFNAAVSTCDYPEEVSCGARIRNPAPFIAAGLCLKQWGTFPDPTDCTAFYECDRGRAFRKVCPYFTAFDQHVLVCVHAHDVDCSGRGGVYGTLAPPVYPLPDPSDVARVQDGRNRVGSSGAGDFVRRPGSSSPSAVGWDRRQSQQQPQQPSSFPGHPDSSSSGHSGSVTGSRGANDIRSGSGGVGGGNDARGIGGGDSRGIGGSDSRKIGGSDSRGAGGSGSRGTGGIDPRGTGGSDSRGIGGSDSQRIGGSDSRGIGGSDSRGIGGSDSRGIGGSDSRGIGGSDSRGIGGSDSRGIGGSDSRGIGGSDSRRVVGSSNSPTGNDGSRGHTGSSPSAGGQDRGGFVSGLPGSRSPGSGSSSGPTGSRGANIIAGITGIIDKDFAATGPEKQYERPLSTDSVFRCPQPRGLYPFALDCTKFWLCREYRPSLLKCPMGQLFDLASLSCMKSEKAQCSSLSPRS